jgi:phosphoenolpyruvate carboxylase
LRAVTPIWSRIRNWRTPFSTASPQNGTSRDTVLALTGQTKLLEHNPALSESIQLRLPYIDALNLLQLDLLRRRRAGKDDDDTLHGIHMSINGISAGLRNSG